MRITYSAAISMDGFIARSDGDVSWLDEQDLDPSEIGWESFFASIDGLVMGRATYDFVFDYGTWPYADKPSWVCTHRELQRMSDATLLVVSEIDDVISQATSMGIDHLWLVGGGQLASSFLNKGLITHLSLAEMPIKLGDGIPLFAGHKLDEIALENRQVTRKTGFRQIEITVQRE